MGLRFNNPASADADVSPTPITEISYLNPLSVGVVINILSGHSNISFHGMGFGSSLFFKVVTADESEYIGDVVEIEYNLTSGGGANLTVVRVIPSVIGNLPGNGGNNNQGGTGQGSGGFAIDPV